MATRLGETLIAGSMSGMNFVENRIITSMYNIILKQKVTDTQTGFRALTKKTIDSINLYWEGIGLSTVFLTETAKKDFRITEIPTICRPRDDESRSKLNRIRAGWEIFRIILLGQA